MSLEAARNIADAVLYEGYLLYPYRSSSLKNQYRWQFGMVAPRSWVEDPSFMQTECWIESSRSPVLDVVVRFLQVQAKTSEWDEGVERSVELQGLVAGSHEKQFEFEPLLGLIRIDLTPSAPMGWRVRVRIENLSEAICTDRNGAMRYSLTGTHTLLSVTGGEFRSALDSPDCENIHTWPVLVGSRNVMLSSPIILQDYPAIAPESPGDFFDGTEIDEMLTLRVITMTDEEKREAAATDDRARRIIERCDSMPRGTLERLHGTFRDEDFFNPAGEQPETQAIAVGTGAVSRGSRVRLMPHRRADSMDMFLKGRVARVESVHRDLENRAYVAVTVEDDPGAGIYNRFYYFFPEELELIEKEN